MNIFLINQIGKAIGVKTHRIAYAIRSGSLPEPQRIGNKRIFTPEQVEEIANYFGSKIDVRKLNETY